MVLLVFGNLYCSATGIVREGRRLEQDKNNELYKRINGNLNKLEDIYLIWQNLEINQ